MGNPAINKYKFIKNIKKYMENNKIRFKKLKNLFLIENHFYILMSLSNIEKLKKQQVLKNLQMMMFFFWSFSRTSSCSRSYFN